MAILRNCELHNQPLTPNGRFHYLTYEECAPDVTEMRTPQLVREFVDNRTAWARGETCTAAQHSRHQHVVTELRSRGVLD